MTQLAPSEIRFEPGSVVDPVGRVFHYQGRVFRGISPPYTEFVAQTVSLAGERGWFEAGLIPTSITGMTLPGYPLVIEHRRIPFFTLRAEWSGEGLRAAALLILELSARLHREQLCLKDSHPWNILFCGTRPFFIDWGSIRPLGELDWSFWYAQFRRFLLAPLYLFSVGEPRIARAMLREHKVGVGNEIIELPDTRGLPEPPRIIAEDAGASPAPETFARLAAYVEGLRLPGVSGEWSDYPQPVFEGTGRLAELRKKDRIVYEILDSDPGATLIDVGANRGLHSEMGASLGKKVLACDIEETCLNAMYARAREAGLDILPLYHDFLWPVGTSGIFNTIPGSEERLKCDTGLFMALIHHLVFKHHISLDSFARAVSSIATRKAVVEFVPAEDEHVSLWSPERFPWYTKDGFIAAMAAYFPRHTVIQSEPYPRTVVVFER